MNNNKRNKMNKMKKIGLSALAGSLAVVSANATEYTMSGGMLSTFTTQDDLSSGASNESGKGFGVATDLAFAASGTLDNGFTVDYAMAVDTNGALSNTSSQLTVGMGSLGTLQLNNKFGSKANGIDDITPNAYNETWDGLTANGTAGTNNPSFFGSSTAAGSIDYRIPTQEIEGMTINASVTYDPNAGAAGASKGGVGADNLGSGSAYTIQIAHESGLEIGGGLEKVDDSVNTVLASDMERTTAYAKFAMSGLSVAHQESYQNTMNGTGVVGADKNSSMTGVAFTQGNYTISYGESELTTEAYGATAALATIQLESIQAAYVMGAMTVSVALSSTDNVDGVLNDNYEENTLAVSFAF